MKRILLIILIFSIYNVYGQKSKQQDSISLIICNRVDKEKVKTYENVIKIFSEEAQKYYQEFPENYSEENYKNWSLLFGDNCLRIAEILVNYANTNLKTKLEVSDKISVSKLTEEKCNKIFEKFEGNYIDYDGSVVKFYSDSKIYQEIFKDGTFSKLYFKNKGNCNFSLTFIETNNAIEKKVNELIDISKVQYQIIDETEKHYMMSISNNDKTFFYNWIFNK